MLPLDLTRRTIRAVPVEERGLAWRVSPIIRCVHTHDAGIPRLLDAAFAARCGSGLLVVSTLDHTTPAGEWFLARLAAFAAAATPGGDDLAGALLGDS
jgi:hypothetical protein